MKKSKEALPPPTTEELMSIAKCLSNKTSLTILKYLYKTGYGLSSSIIKATGFQQSTISKQLKRLTQLGLVTKESFRTCKIFGLNKEYFKHFGLSVETWLEVDRIVL